MNTMDDIKKDIEQRYAEVTKSIAQLHKALKAKEVEALMLKGEYRLIKRLTQKDDNEVQS